MCWEHGVRLLLWTMWELSIQFGDIHHLSRMFVWGYLHNVYNSLDVCMLKGVTDILEMAYSIFFKPKQWLKSFKTLIQKRFGHTKLLLPSYRPPLAMIILVDFRRIANSDYHNHRVKSMFTLQSTQHSNSWNSVVKFKLPASTLS